MILAPLPAASLSSASLSASERRSIESEQLLRVLLDGPLALAVSSVDDGRWLRVNDAFLLLTGYTPAEITEVTPRALGLWLDEREAARLLRAARRGTPTHGRDLAFRRRDREQRHGLVTVEPVELGGQACALWLLQDVTERKRAEDALQRQNALLSALTRVQAEWIGGGEERAPLEGLLGALVAATGSTGGVIAELRQRDDGAPYLVTVALSEPGDGEFERALHARHVRDGLEVHQLGGTVFGEALARGRVEVNAPPGSLLPLADVPVGPGVPRAAFATSLRGPGGEVVGVLVLVGRPGGYAGGLDADVDAFVGACGTIVHARHALRLRRLAERALRESEERFRLLVDGAVDYALIMLDPYGRVTSWNAGAHHITGWVADDVLGVHVSCFYPPEAKGQAERELELAEREGRCVVEGERERQGGARFWASVTLTALRDHDGVLRGFAQLTRDITAGKQLERMKDEFVSTVSHELRTPLTSIRGALGLLDAGVTGELPGEAAELVNVAHHNCERLVRLINDILDVQKIEAGKLTVRPVPAAPERVVRATVDELRAMAGEHGVGLDAEIAGAQAWLADDDRIAQVLTNLISNAVKFSPRGARVDVRVVAGAPGRARVEVVDRGPGIAPDKLHLLFGRFQQLDGSDARQKGGTGLGLAISKAIVELHGGVIGVDSAPGRGSTFWFELPLADAAKGSDA